MADRAEKRDVLVIVGAGPGIGLSVARRFGQEGFVIALIARRTSTVAALVRTLAAEGIEAHGFLGDASDPGSLERALEGVRLQLGAPHVLVYNAAVLRRHERVTQVGFEGLMETLAVNVAGALHSVACVEEEMRAAGAGTILLTGGGLALRPMPAFASLAIGKAGLRTLAMALAPQLAEDGIHVATVTVCGFVAEGGPFDPAHIAQVYWALHEQPRAQWETEVQYTGA